MALQFGEFRDALTTAKVDNKIGREDDIVALTPLGERFRVLDIEFNENSGETTLLIDEEPYKAKEANAEG